MVTRNSDLSLTHNNQKAHLNLEDENFKLKNNQLIVNDLKYLKKEYLSINYDFNMFGYKGPRQMSIIIPGMDSKFNREDFYIKNKSDSLQNAWRYLETNLQIKKNKTTALNMTKTHLKKDSLYQEASNKDNKSCLNKRATKIGLDIKQGNLKKIAK